MRSHGGTLLYAPSHDHGAAFTIELPVRAVPHEVQPVGIDAPGVGPLPTPTRSTGPAPPDSARAGRVLVLDDDRSFRAFLERALSALGYEPDVAASAQQAIDLVTAEDHAAILCDQRMPGMTGMEVYDAVVAIRPEVATRFVVMSGDVVDPALETFAATHGVTRLAKPFDLDTLDRTLRAVLADRGQSRG